MDTNQANPTSIPETELLRQIVDNAPMLLFVRDTEGRYLMVNRLYEQLIGMDRSKIIGKRPHDIFDSEHAGEYLSHDTQVIKANHFLNFEERSIVQGEERVWNALKTPVYDSAGNICGVAGMSSDITARKRAEQELRKVNRTLEAANIELRSTQELLIQAEKLESIGRLAAGVAHEVKNPLALILMGVEYLNSLPTGIDPNLAEILDEMRKAVRRAETIIHGLVDLSASRQLEIRPVDLNRVVLDTLPFIKHDRLRFNVGLDVCLAQDLPLVALDVQKFEQVLLNLLLNAIHAMGSSGGNLKVTTRAGAVAEGERNDPGSRAGDRLRRGDNIALVTVEDTGCGISPADLERIFDPFYTTKPTGEGTGLGLSISRKIIELHGGRISARSQVGKGTCITIMLRALPRGKNEIMRDKAGQNLIESTQESEMTP